MFLPRNCV
ncbi:hypothetical protein LUU34_00389000 [Aix galericulata]|nr:hypothetical protein LUU34_00389000 [Aix galericulata]